MSADRSSAQVKASGAGASPGEAEGAPERIVAATPIVYRYFGVVGEFDLALVVLGIVFAIVTLSLRLDEKLTSPDFAVCLGFGSVLVVSGLIVHVTQLRTGRVAAHVKRSEAAHEKLIAEQTRELSEMAAAKALLEERIPQPEH